MQESGQQDRAGASPEDVSFVREHVRRVPGWAAVEPADVRPITTGATNRSIGFAVDGQPYLIRVSGPNTDRLHINRAAEHAAFVAAAAVDAAPRVVHFFPASGHLIRAFVPGTQWTWDDLKDDAVVEQCLATLRRAHGAAPIDFRLDPFHDVERRIDTAGRRGLARPDRLPDALARMRAVDDRWWLRSPDDRGLCHGDAFINNYLRTTDGRVILIDWEFAGMSDVYWDLVALGWFADGERRAWFLRLAFGREPTGDMLAKFGHVRWLSTLWNWTWAHLQMHEADAKPEHARLEKSLWSGVVGGLDAPAP